jgi:hypothetical protein
MALVFEPAAERPTEAEVADFEREIGFRLPPAHRAFLLTHNGGKFPHLVSVTAPAGTASDVIWHLEFHGRAEPPLGGYEDRFMLNSLYCLGRSWRDPMRDLREVYKVSLDWAHPRALLPIGHDPGNNQYFLCLSGRRAGAICLREKPMVKSTTTSNSRPLHPTTTRCLPKTLRHSLTGSAGAHIA